MSDIEQRVVIALDVGGTSVKSAVVVNENQLIHEPIMTALNSSGTAEEILSTLTNIVSGHVQELSNLQLLGVAFGFPGPFDYDTGVCRIEGVSKYESIYGMNIAAELRHRLGLNKLPMLFRNDAEAAIVGEALHGIGHGSARVIGVTLGTGFGSAFLVNGRSVTSGDGVPPNGWLYPVLYEGQMADDVFSIRGLQRAFHESGLVVENIKQAADLAAQGNKVAEQVFAEFGRHLAIFLQPWVDAFRADAVLLLGGIANAYKLFAPQLTTGLPVPALAGELGAKAPLFGAAALFEQSEV